MPALIAALGFTAPALPAPPIERAGFQDAMRKLWVDHVTWTPLHFVRAAAGRPDARATAEGWSARILGPLPRQFT